MSNKINRVAVAYFSPTHTSKTIALNIASGTGLPVSVIDMTFHVADALELDDSTLLVCAMPVYGGKIPPIAAERFAGIKGKNTSAVAVVCYGNRDFEKAALQLSDLLANQGFATIAAGAFVGEHSYSTEQTPIAVGRPNADDCTEAVQFGKQIMVKLDADGAVPVNLKKFKAPSSGIINYLRFVKFVLDYQKKSAQAATTSKPTPKVDKAKCVSCGLCVSECPTRAIQPGDELHTDAGKCIRCCACVKCCPEKARTFKTPFAPALSEYFARQKPNRVCLK